MSEIEELLERIKELKFKLEKLIMEKCNLLDPDVIAASKMIDALLNEYQKQLMKQEEKIKL